jgi:hypothetical protein
VNLISPKTSILPPAQKILWPVFRALERGFVLYGGTAIALRYAHRPSVDFDFFAVQSFDPDAFKAKYEFLKKGQTIQLGTNTLSVLVPTARGEVKLSFFGGLDFGRAGHPDVCDDNLVRLASPLDLAIQKLKIIRVRSEAKDYLDLDCLLRNGVDLAVALGAAQVLYPDFPIPVTLRAMCYFDDGDVGTIPGNVKKRLVDQAGRFKAPIKGSRTSKHLDLTPDEIERAAQALSQAKGHVGARNRAPKPRRKR